MQNSADLRKLTTEAKKLFSELNQAEDSVHGGLDHAIDQAWQFGKLLNKLKEVVGHGAWAKWREDSFQGLDDRKAQRCQALDRDNPNASSWTDLSKPSIRKYRHIYIPVKDRPKLKGDKKFARPSHHSSVVNECNKLAQRVDAGQYKPNKRELQRDFKPFYEWLTKLYQA